MIYDISITALVFFFIFVGLVLGLSFYFGRKKSSSSSYYAAGGQIHWAVNGIAFAGDYLSAASFLGICGMIAIAGFDGFLYAIGFLAGWIVALFLIAEPFKRLGKYTFTDALNAKFNSRAITLTASISTLIISVFYLIPQMVGAGDLVMPLLGLPHWAGVILVGAIVIAIVASAGMASTTYVQFLKGGLLIVLSLVLTFYILKNGLSTPPEFNGNKYHAFIELVPEVQDGKVHAVEGWDVLAQQQIGDKTFVKLAQNGVERWFDFNTENTSPLLKETLTITQKGDGSVLYNGEPKENRKFYQVGHLSKIIVNGEEVKETGPLNPFQFLSTIKDSEIVRFQQVKLSDGNDQISVYYPEITPGSKYMLPGLKYKIGSGADLWSKMDFVSLMLALFLGTAALPHILIRYYTVKTPRDARKSTILAIAAIGGFYILTLFIGLGAGVNGVMDVESSNMAAPLLARAFGAALFSIISAVAFATVLGTVAGLIVASSGAIAHDFIDGYLKKNLDDAKKVKVGKIAAVVVGIFAILLGMAFQGINVSFLVGWAFAIAASANLPAILFLLFWKKTSSTGISSSIVVGIVASLAIILTSPTMWDKYGLGAGNALHQLENPALISFPLAVLTVYIFSKLYPKKAEIKS
ncbi:cation acetate symporter [Sphingobacterium sp. UT-1RO-CII-1]|uniref:solute symporter family protein n=1 Tax=Sphingobacterium sp. UT-1RO-CII-1 TaxID=2995225 RepID=UPI00227A144A|nr:cation acetate symporter [Sphingobacterium sp. UT-1RO-CII-1]MCY4780340.1 cation acetate symporter [Sphingobacterium sp. UT-1RO-CII-1]